MGTKIGELFEGNTFLNGGVWLMEPQQNEKHGKVRIQVWNGYGYNLVDWTGHQIPKKILDKIEELEEQSNVSSGLYYLWLTGKLA